VELMLGAMYFVYKFLQADVIFFAGFALYAAGDIDGIGTHEANRFCYVFDLETARKNDAAGKSSAPREIPIGGSSGAAVLTGARGVEKESEDFGEFIERRSCEIGIHAKGFDDGKGSRHAGDYVGSFVTMELRGVEAHECAE